MAFDKVIAFPLDKHAMISEGVKRTIEDLCSR
jgi:hypothetical protein